MWREHPHTQFASDRTVEIPVGGPDRGKKFKPPANAPARPTIVHPPRSDQAQGTSAGTQLAKLSLSQKRLGPFASNRNQSAFRPRTILGHLRPIASPPHYLHDISQLVPGALGGRRCGRLYRYWWRALSFTLVFHLYPNALVFIGRHGRIRPPKDVGNNATAPHPPPTTLLRMDRSLDASPTSTVRTEAAVHRVAIARGG